MKFMNMKRFASTVMAGVLTLSLAAPAFAAANTTVITGTYQDIEIAVEVPTTGTAQINPYGLPVTIDKTDRTTAQIVDQKITTQPMNIKNQGTTPLDVNATLAVIPKGDVEIKTSLTPATDTGKQMKVTLEVAGLNDPALKVASTDRTVEDKLIDKFADDATWAALTTANQLVAPAAAKAATTVTPSSSGAALATLGAATVDGTLITYGAKSIALVRLSGELNESPKASGGADDPWKTTDGFEATVVFSFKPAAKLNVTVTQPASGGSIAASASKAWEGTEVTLSFTPPTANPTHVPTYTVTGATSNDTYPVTDGKFTMPDEAVSITVTFAAP